MLPCSLCSYVCSSRRGDLYCVHYFFYFLAPNVWWYLESFSLYFNSFCVESMPSCVFACFGGPCGIPPFHQKPWMLCPYYERNVLRLYHQCRGMSQAKVPYFRGPKSCVLSPGHKNAWILSDTNSSQIQSRIQSYPSPCLVEPTISCCIELGKELSEQDHSSIPSTLYYRTRCERT